jgi:hypothetical protein
VIGGPGHALDVSGTAQFNFDFGAGRLSGSMSPSIPEGGWAGIGENLGNYEFTQTIFNSGSTSFSGKFLVPNLPSADSHFSGLFTGPAAAELMGRFEAPFLSKDVGGDIIGVFIGKK